jgi:phosphoribosyl 1,2-cyclic phosphate phosphodiesterase
LKITFLGTGTSQGIPVIACNCEICTSDDFRDNRLRTSILIQTESTTVVIDSGPDFRQQMLREKVKNLNAIVFTHEHKDHIAGMDDVRAFNYIQKKKIPIYATQRVQQALKREFAYVFSEEKYPGIPEIELVDIDTDPFNINGIKLIPIDVKHLNMPVKAYRIGDFTYITDANYISDSEKEKIIGSKTIVVNALRHEKHVSHFNFKEAIELIDELKPEKAYFTHISHQLGKHDEISKLLPNHIELAYDGLQISI